MKRAPLNSSRTPAARKTGHEDPRQIGHEDHVALLLDLALEATFPASDAIALPLGAASAPLPAPVPLVTEARAAEMAR